MVTHKATKNAAKTLTKASGPSTKSDADLKNQTGPASEAEPAQRVDDGSVDLELPKDLPGIEDSLPIALFVLDGAAHIVTMNAEAETLLSRSRSSSHHHLLADFLIFPAGWTNLLARAQYRGTVNLSTSLQLVKAAFRVDHATDTAHDAIAPLSAPFPAELWLRAREGSTDRYVLLVQRRIERLAFVPNRASPRVAGLASLIAHEVRNPLAGLKGAAQFLMRDQQNSNRELLEVIVQESDRIARLIDRLDGVLPYVPDKIQRFNIHEILRRAEQLARNSFAHRIAIEENFDPSLPEIDGHADLVLQAVLNLIKNSAEAIGDFPKQPGRILISTRIRRGIRLHSSDTATQSGIEISIADNGPGIPQSVRDHLFEPFFSTKSRGAGLGLSVVADAANAHQGLIECDRVDDLTVFRLLIPLSPRNMES